MTYYKNAPRYSGNHAAVKREKLRALVPAVRKRFPGAAIYVGKQHLLVEHNGRMYQVTEIARGGVPR
jgi:hypothetical protein